MQIIALHGDTDATKISEILEDLQKRYPHGRYADHTHKYLAVRRRLDPMDAGLKQKILEIADYCFWTDNEKKEIADIATGKTHAAYELCVTFHAYNIVDIIIARHAKEKKGIITYIYKN